MSQEQQPQQSNTELTKKNIEILLLNKKRRLL
jgi:hypothetical protein